MTDESRPVGLRQGLALRRWAAWGAQSAPRWFVRFAPPIIGGVLGSLSSARRAVLRNLRLIHGTRAPWIEAWDTLVTFSHFAVNLTESLAPGRGIYAAKHFQIRGAEAVRRLLRERKGVLFVTAHAGPWDGAAMALAAEWSVPVMMLMSQEADAAAGALQDAVRAGERIRVLRVGESSLDALPALEHLSAGGAIVAQLDRVPEGRPPLWGQLMGRPFPVPRGLFLLAGLAKVAVVPVFTARLSGGRKVAEVGEPIFVTHRASDEALLKVAQLAIHQLERHLAAFPNQWFHFVEPTERAVSASSAETILARRLPQSD